MELALTLWQALLISFALGAAAAWISQFSASKKGLEAKAKAGVLERNVENLVERNSARRKKLQPRQDVLDKYQMMQISEPKGQLNDSALNQAIDDEKKRVKALTAAINKSEEVITETRTTLGNTQIELSTISGWLTTRSVVIGGVTATIFGGLGFLGLKEASLTNVPVTSNLVIQSLALGGGWPLVWEKFFSSENLDAAATVASEHFNQKVKEAESEVV